MKNVLFLLLSFALLMPVGLIVACGDDDDDDDDDDDAADGEVDKTACHAYHDACLSENTPENFCAGYYDDMDECMVEAADALFECLGTDCDADLYTDCTDQYLEDAQGC